MDKEYILIFGASSGIGRDVAEYLNSKGKNIVLVGRNSSRLEQICSSLNGENFWLSYDLFDVSNIKSIFDFTSQRNIKFSGMVYTAGYAELMPIKINPIENTLNMLNVNANAFLEAGKYFCRKKYSVDGAKIVAISSIEAELKEKGFVSYSASKNLLEVYVKILAKENVSRGICVNAIRPANVRTPMYTNAIEIDNTLEDNYLKKQPLGIIDVRQVTYLIDFLLSDKGKYMTGECVDISAGWSV